MLKYPDPNSRQTHTVSLCMIVKDEEALLPKCLQSVADKVDEIVVVDTGSTDRSVAIAKSFGARVFHHPWEGDFSKHRNQSISYARGSWILVLDADEILSLPKHKKIRDFIDDTTADSIMVNVVNLFHNGASRSITKQVRIFKKDPHIQYKSIVHNQLYGYRKTIKAPIWIYHYGYDLDPDKMRAKFLRTASLIRKKIRLEPKNFRNYHDLAVSYSMNRQPKKAISAAKKAIRLALKTENKGGVLILWTYFIVSSSQLALGQFEKARSTAQLALKAFPMHLDSHYIVAMASYVMRDWEVLKSSAESYLYILNTLDNLPTEYGYIVNNTVGEVWKICLALADYYLEKKMPERAEVFFDKVEKCHPKTSKSYRILGDTFFKRGFWQRASQNYEKSLRLNDQGPNLMLRIAYAKLQLGQLDDALSWSYKVINSYPDNPTAYELLGDVFYIQNDLRSASDFYHKALARDENSVSVNTKLARVMVRLAHIEDCVKICERLLKALNLPFDLTLNSVSDLANLFLIIAHEFDIQGNDSLFRAAIETALILDPKITQVEA